MVIASILSMPLLSLLAPVIHRALGRWSGYLFAAVPLASFAYFLTLLPRVAAGDPLMIEAEWIPALGVSIGLVVDGLSLLFALLITGIGSMVLLYATAYMRGDPLAGRFFGYLIGFMMSMLGLVLCDNLLLLFIFWELTSITSYLLIGFYHNNTESRKSALQALLVTGIGGLALLAGAILTGLAGGTFSISELAANGGIADSPLYTGALVCVLLAAFTKSAQYPFHFWLPNAMAAPSPVSAFLHSSTMVKAGVFLLARMSPVLGGTQSWTLTLGIVGGVTMVIAAWAASRRTKLKPILAYSTVSSLGLITMMIGVGTEEALIAAMAYLLAHAFFKAALFLIAGGVTHETHEKDTEKLGGLRKAMPISCWCAVIAGLSLAGAPPVAGFVGKELVLKAGYYQGGLAAVLLMAATFVAAALTVMAALIVVWRVFFTKPAEGVEVKAYEVPWEMRVGPIVLAACTIVAALAPGLFAKPMIESAALASLGGAFGGELHHPAKLSALSMLIPTSLSSLIPLLLSLSALAGGAFLYRARTAWRRESGFTRAADIYRPENAYFRLLDGTIGFAGLQTRILQNGSLSAYIRVILLALLGLGGYTLLRSEGLFANMPSFTDLRPLEAMIALIIVICTVAATAAPSRLATIAVLGAVGYSVALIYVLFGAPDLAMTQFAVETLSVVIFVLVVYHLPRFAWFSRRRVLIMVAVVAGAFGSFMAAFTLAALEVQVAPPISSFFAENSYPLGQGKNVINVILVDFRSIDTLGEIVVLGIAAVGVFTLLRLRKERKPADIGSSGSPPSLGAAPLAPASPRDAEGSIS